VVIFDEVDAYPPSAGVEGDPIRLGTMRSQAFWNRKIIAGSTPLLAGTSRIAELYETGDQRRYFVPCPHCGHRAPLVFRGDGGHVMHWPEGEPEKAHFVCQANGCVIEHQSKRAMVAAGEWRAAKPFAGHASFHIWAAYSFSPNATWADIAAEFVEANAAGPEKLKTFVNTWLGETWQERGEAPDWLRLYRRREPYQLGTVPAGVCVLTAGVDVQRDRLVVEVVGWGADRQSWTIDATVIPGAPADEGPAGPWPRLDELLAHQWPGADGAVHTIFMLAIDSGDQTQAVYSWARRHPMSRVIATKGSASARALISTPSPVDVTVRGKKLRGGYKVWVVGSNIAKAELYGWLRLEAPLKLEDASPAGFCHFSDGLPDEYFKQLTAEHLVEVRSRRGYTTHEWQVLPGRENHWLDCRVLARAASALAGLDRLAASRRPAPASSSATPPRPESPPAESPVQTSVPGAPERRAGGWIGGSRRVTGPRGSWINPRR
jgi:phage terminase large subunit GpA-like protein